LKHKHHIIPKHAGGTDDPSNLVELTIEEHAEAHRVLWETHGRWQDKLAWLGLTGQVGTEEARLEAIRQGVQTRDMSYFQTDEWKKRVKGWMSGRVVSDITKARMSKPKSSIHRQNLREHLTKHNTRPQSDEFRQHMSQVVKASRMKCPLCDFESTRTHVTRHINKAHKNG
jgi:hypothetical protein